MLLQDFHLIRERVSALNATQRMKRGQDSRPSALFYALCGIDSRLGSTSKHGRNFIAESRVSSSRSLVVVSGSLAGATFDCSVHSL